MKSIGIIVVLALAVGQALASGVAGDKAPSADAVRKAGKGEAAAAQSDDSASMREGVVAAINTAGDQVQINGSWLTVATGKTRIFQQGRAVKSDALAKGQKVRFTLAPGAGDRTTLGVVYVP